MEPDPKAKPVEATSQGRRKVQESSANVSGPCLLIFGIPREH